jgi:hypothetical protein
MPYQFTESDGAIRGAGHKPVFACPQANVMEGTILWEKSYRNGAIQMKRMNLFLILIFVLTSLAWAQDASPQAPPSMASPDSRDQMRSEHHQKMMEMHKQQMDAMKADMEKMKSSLAQMKADVAGIGNSGEKRRWQSNVDMWEVLIGHMDQMLKHMDSMGPGSGMGPGMMHHPGMGGPPPAPPVEKKPE